ncbi:MAG: hypothetical protein M3Z03_07440 [Actinomycetota bacterium]|nr:hypothetical protein [Actinomycetota bacterium]
MVATDNTRPADQPASSRRALIEVSPDLAARFGDPRLPLALVAGICGAVALLIGYFGVSGTLDPAKQLPYLISGGVGGLFLLGVAAALLFSADLGATRADVARLHDVVADLSDQIADLQASLDAPAPPAPAPARTRTAKRAPARR